MDRDHEPQLDQVLDRAGREPDGQQLGAGYVTVLPFGEPVDLLGAGE
jgi:hypothetical protein